MATASVRPQHLIGKSPDRLTIGERRAAAGKWIALETYTPETLPIRVIEAVGDTPGECIRQLEARKLDPRIFEFSILSFSF